MSNRKPIISTLNVNQNLHCDLDESGHVSRKSRRTCWKMPEYDEKMDYILFEDYDLIHEDDKWVLIEDMKIFQSIIEDFMQSPVSSEKEIRTKQMSKDVQNFLLRQQSLKNYDNLIKNVENLELSQVSKCSSSYERTSSGISDTNCPYWGEWIDGHCSKSCGPGTKTISRNCYRNNYIVSNDLCLLEYPDQQIYTKTEHCTDTTYCLYEAWSSWSECDKSCGTGSQQRWRNCPSKSCKGSDVEKRPCNAHQCPYWGDWIYGECSQSCGQGWRTVERNCYYKDYVVAADDCLQENPDQQIYSKTEHCTVNTYCSWERWGSWNNCDKSCGTGTQKRWRKCPSNSCKGSDNEKRLCNTRKCISQWSSWTSSGTCSKPRLEITK